MRNTKEDRYIDENIELINMIRQIATRILSKEKSEEKKIALNKLREAALYINIDNENIKNNSDSIKGSLDLL